MDQKQKIAGAMKALEKDYRQYKKPEVVRGLQAGVLERVWDIFSSSVVTPEGAPFVVGRIYEALDPYRQLKTTIAKYEGLENKLGDIVRAEDVDKVSE